MCVASPQRQSATGSHLMQSNKFGMVSSRMFLTSQNINSLASSTHTRATDDKAGCMARLKLKRVLGKAGFVKGEFDNHGSAFVCVFQDAHRPGNANNVAMVYVTGAAATNFETAESAEFLESMRTVARNAMEVVQAYNGSVDPHERIQNVRWTPVSQGLFLRDQHAREIATREQVARASIQGTSRIGSNSMNCTL